MMDVSPIDAVFLWCDGNDPTFVKSKQALLAKLGLPWNESNMGEIRFTDNDELKYSLRSVYQYLPWINHVYIVTNKQRPVWFKENDWVTIVDHEEIIPHEFLPTFNSVTIETYLSKIPGLSEKFLLFNDDIFINAPLTPSFFFEGECPRVRLLMDQKRWQFGSVEEAQNALEDSNVSSFRKTIINAWIAFSKKHGVSPFYVLAHTVDAYTKSCINQVQSQYPELLERNNYPFRTDRDIQRVIYQMEMVQSMNCPLTIAKLPTFFQKHLPFIANKSLETFEGTESKKTWSRIRSLKPKMFCLNAAMNPNSSIKEESRRLLEELFPNPSPNEKP